MPSGTAAFARVTRARPLHYTFPGEPGQVARMRETLRRYLADCRCPGAAVDDILVCASELATNAVLHSRSGQPGGRFSVEVALRGGQSAYVAIRDSGGPWAERDNPVRDEDAECGRGLNVVAGLAAEMGIAGDVSGRTAWFLSQWEPVPR